MKIKVSSIPEAGERYQETYLPQVLDLERFDVKVNRPFNVNYHILKEGEEVFVRAEVKVCLEIICARCLDKAEFIIEKDYNFTYRVKPTDILDTTEDIRQEIILDYPLKPLCKPDCLGLCPKCGGNLNRGECRCNLNQNWGGENGVT
ncbi:MAG: DUF177 domain-containing protein [Candidatus Omnitrophica bacterium]|nr:DUF177 domain-containing protein [Candidatus Omnitrophota bacterium]MCM8793267.1 DUF177 domain-containing protein [Candidatus Omnitrophota bacterium]